MPFSYLSTLGSNSTGLYQLKTKSLRVYLYSPQELSGRRILHTNQLLNADQGNDKTFSLSEVT